MKKKYLEFNTNINMLEKSIHKQKLLLVAISSTVVLLTGCQSEDITSNNTNSVNNQVIDNKTTENDDTDTITTVEPNIPEVTPSVVENSSGESAIRFSELSKYQFVFSSGAGAWQTILNINEDGTFKGYYSDSDMGDTGEGYPNGINYSSTFEGKFTTPKRVNDYTYSMLIEAIKLEKEVGSEEIIDGIKYIYSEPYGLDHSKEIYIYTTQAPLKELPEGFRSWVGYMELSDRKEKYLPFYGLYNVETESGFSSYVIVETEEDNTEFDITAEVAEIEKKSEEMNNRLKTEDLNQSMMNLLAKDIYVLWDDEINQVWKYLKDTLDKDEMDNLTSVQKEWIVKKENEVKKAGSEYEGGSIRPMIEFLKGAEITRERVYELVELLK